MDQSQFESQLGHYKNVLLGLYKEKTKAVAERESLRFQYVTVLKTKYGSVVGDMIGATFGPSGSSVSKSLCSDLIANLTEMIKHWIPMTNMKGEDLDGWMMNPQSLGRYNSGFLSPIENLISLPVSNEEQRSPYEIYGSGGWVSSGRDYVMTTYFMNATQSSTTDENGQVLLFSLPPSKDWLKSFIRNLSPDLAMSVDACSDFVNKVMTTDMPSGNFIGVVGELKSTLEQIIDKTNYILNLEDQIRSNESELSSFVTDYSQFAGTLNVAGMLSDLRDEAAKTDQATASPVVSAVAPKSKLPWMIAIGVGAALLMGKSKSQ